MNGYWSKVLAIGLILVFFSLLIFILLKTFYLNQPKIRPEMVVIFYLKLEQNNQRKLAEKYLFPDFERVEILSEKYSLLSLSHWIQKEKTGEESVFQAKEIKIGKKEARVKIFEKTNKKQGWIFFNYYLPKEIIFEANLIKVGNWKKGKQWKIIRINSPDLIWEEKMGEKGEIREGIFILPMKLEKLEIPAERKIYSLEVEYENNSQEIVFISPFGDWQIVDLNGERFSPPSVTSAIFLREPILFGGELKPGEKRRGYVMFEIEREISAKELIFKNMEKKVIFKID